MQLYVARYEPPGLAVPVWLVWGAVDSRRTMASGCGLCGQQYGDQGMVTRISSIVTAASVDKILTVSFVRFTIDT